MDDVVLTPTPLPKYYSIDWAKVKTLDDVKVILRAFDIRISSNYIRFDEIRQWLDIPDTQ